MASYNRSKVAMGLHEADWVRYFYAQYPLLYVDAVDELRSRQIIGKRELRYGRNAIKVRIVQNIHSKMGLQFLSVISDGTYHLKFRAIQPIKFFMNCIANVKRENAYIMLKLNVSTFNFNMFLNGQ